MLKTILTMISYMYMLFLFEIWLVGIIIIIPIIRHQIAKAFSIKQFKIIKERTNLERKSFYWNYIITNGECYKELKIYNLFEYFREKYFYVIKKFNTQDLDLLKKSNIILTIINIIELIIDGILLLYVAYKGYIGTILIGNVITYIKLIMQMKSSFNELSQYTAILPKDSLFIDQFYNFLNMDTSYNSNEKSEERKSIDYINEIRVENLYYRYTDSKDYILKNINLSIRTGNLYALVGRNGSGKTTLIKILLGFYDNYEGEIYVNNINLKEIDKSSYMKKVGALFQDFTKYEATLRENISYGNLDILDNDELIIKIIKMFKIDSMIDKSEKN